MGALRFANALHGLADAEVQHDLLGASRDGISTNIAIQPLHLRTAELSVHTEISINQGNLLALASAHVGGATKDLSSLEGSGVHSFSAQAHRASMRGCTPTLITYGGALDLASAVLEHLGCLHLSTHQGKHS